MDRGVLPVKMSILQIQSYLEMTFTIANQQLCDFVNNEDFPLYLQDGTKINNISYTSPSLFTKTNNPPFKADGKYYNAYDLYGLRDEIIQCRKDNINLDRTIENADYLDPDSKYYAEEMHLAAQIHKAIYIDKFGDVNLDRKSTVSAWLDKYKPDLKVSEAMLSRLTTIVGTK